jgi:hypothetical protein
MSGHHGRVSDYSKDPTYIRRRVAYDQKIRADESDLLNKEFQPELCERCRSIRWSALAVTNIPILSHRLLESEWPVYKAYDTPVNTEEPEVQIQESSCGLCRYAASMFEGSSRPLYWSLSASSWDLGADQDGREILHPAFLSFHSSSLSISSSLGILRQSQGESDLVPYAITSFLENYAMLRGWLTLCETSHGSSCQPNHLIDLPGFKVLDCRTRNVVPAPYVTPWPNLRINMALGSES